MSRPTKTLLDEKALQAVMRGINAVYEPVRRTLGPNGKKSLLFRSFNRGSRMADDGYVTAECQNPKDEFVRLAAEAFKEGIKKTNQRVGDGTTSTGVIAGRLANDGYKLLSQGISLLTTQRKGRIGATELSKAILNSADKVKEEIKKVAQKIETLEQLERIAIISVGEEALGKSIAKIAWEIGVDGFIDVVEGYKGEIETQVVKGMRFPAKVGAKAFVNNPARYEMIAQDCPVFITNYALDNALELEFFQEINKTNAKIIVIAPSFTDNVLTNMVAATKAGFFIYPVAVPSLRTEQFEDLAIYCGAEFIDKNKGKKLKNVVPGDLGFLEKLVVKDTETKEDAIATGGKGTKEQQLKVGQSEYAVSSAVSERIKTLKGQMEETRQDSFKKLLERRIASMASAVGIVRVGSPTDAETLPLKLKVEDATSACKAALRGGYVKGGGLCLKEIADILPDEDVLKAALKAPYEQIQSSQDGGLEITEEIIDPMEAVYYEVEYATSVVANMLTIGSITVEVEDMTLADGYTAMARMIGELSIALKRHYGQLKESEEEAERDRLKGLTVDEMVSLDNG